MKSLPDFRAAKASLGREAMQWTRIQRNWNEFRGKVKEKWEKLTDDDLRVIDGRRDKLEGKDSTAIRLCLGSRSKGSR